MKTATEIELYIRSLIEKSPLKSMVKGGVYTSGLRPLDSKKEDVTITFVAGLDGQISTGVVMVNIYVPNIDAGKDIFVKDAARCAQLEKAALEFRNSIPTNEFLFTPDATIQSNPVEGIQQYYINIRLKYRLWQN